MSVVAKVFRTKCKFSSTCYLVVKIDKQTKQKSKQKVTTNVKYPYRLASLWGSIRSYSTQIYDNIYKDM